MLYEVKVTILKWKQNTVELPEDAIILNSFVRSTLEDIPNRKHWYQPTVVHGEERVIVYLEKVNEKSTRFCK